MIDYPRVPLAAFRTDEKPETCQCPECGRLHWKMNFGRPPDSTIAAKEREIAALRARVAKLEAALEAGDKPSPQRAIQNDGLN